MTCTPTPYGGGACKLPTVTTIAQHIIPPAAHAPLAHALPFTGGDVVGLSILGIGLLAGGIALVRAGRRVDVAAPPTE
jgi:hypothetical protein